MSKRGIDFALAFVQSQPGTVARLLEGQPKEDVATFIGEIPHTHAASILERMLPQYTAELCTLLDVEASAGFLSRMDTSLVAATLRYLKPQRRSELNKLLPKRMRVACKILLSYSEETVGAWMVPNAATLPNDCSVEEALERLKTEEGFTDLDDIFVIDRDGGLKGQTKCKTLLLAEPETPIAGIMNQQPRSVLGRTNLTTAQNHIGWKTRDALPVVNRGDVFVGVIRHTDLRTGLAQLKKPANQSSEPGLVLQLMKAYADSLIEMASTLSPIKRNP